jgi:hypothetical protein
MGRAARSRFRAEDVKDVLDPGLARGGQPPQVGAPDHRGTGTKRERLDHVAPAPDPAVEQNLDLIADGLGNRRKRADRCRRPVQVIAPWLETEIALKPASTARLASSTRITPLSMNGPSYVRRSQRRSSQLGGGVIIHSP